MGIRLFIPVWGEHELMSIFGDILTSVETRLDGITDHPTIYIRKKPILLPEDDVPCLIVSPGREVITDENFDNVVQYEYEVQISHIRAGDREYGRTDTLALLDLREDIRNTLYQVLLPGAQSIDVKMELNPPFEVASGKASNYDISGYIMKYKVMETRTS